MSLFQPTYNRICSLGPLIKMLCQFLIINIFSGQADTGIQTRTVPVKVLMLAWVSLMTHALDPKLSSNYAR